MAEEAKSSINSEKARQDFDNILKEVQDEVQYCSDVVAKINDLATRYEQIKGYDNQELEDERKIEDVWNNDKYPPGPERKIVGRTYVKVNDMYEECDFDSLKSKASRIGNHCDDVKQHVAKCVADGKSSLDVVDENIELIVGAVKDVPINVPSRAATTRSQGKLPSKTPDAKQGYSRVPSRAATTRSQGKLPSKTKSDSNLRDAANGVAQKIVDTATSRGSSSNNSNSSGAGTGVAQKIVDTATSRGSSSNNSNLSGAGTGVAQSVVDSTTLKDNSSLSSDQTTPSTSDPITSATVSSDDTPTVTSSVSQEIVTPAESQEVSEYSSIPNTGVGEKSSNNHLFPAAVGAVLGATGLAASMLHKDDKEDENNTDEANVKD